MNYIGLAFQVTDDVLNLSKKSLILSPLNDSITKIVFRNIRKYLYSSKTILRDNKINSLIGNWKWILKEGNWAIREDNLGGKMITITKDEILFYEIYRTSKKWD